MEEDEGEEERGKGAYWTEKPALAKGTGGRATWGSREKRACLERGDISFMVGTPF